MKFIINRVSGETPPCEGAVSEWVTYTHQQKCHFSDKLSAALRWLGTHNQTYRIENGFHKWEVTLKKWIVEIHTLEELIALQKKIGDDLILSSDEYPCLKIYDDYIE